MSRNPLPVRIACFILLAFVYIFVIGANRSQAGDNYAFLVAVGDYDVKHLKPLKYTRNDILEFQKLLLASGFPKENIVLLHDNLRQLSNRRFIPNAEEIRKEFTLLLSTLEKDDTLIVAMAGHGVQFKGDKSSYFCPADADLDDRQHSRLIAFNELYMGLEKCEARKKLLIIDACRNDPQSQLSRTRATVNLESITRPQSEPLPEGIVALFSCSSGEQAFEWPELEHGIFFHHVLEGWRGAADDGDKELSLDELVAFTRKKTQEFARLKLASIQRPQRLGEFSGTWTLRKLVASELITNSIGMKLKLIPAGEFLMGSRRTAKELALLFDSKESTFENEYPQHRVKITKPFYMGIFKVTVGQFREFVAATGYKTDAEKEGKGGRGWNESTEKFEFHQTKFNWQNTGVLQTNEHPVVNVSWNDADAFCRWLSQKEGSKYRLAYEAESEYACRAGSKTIFHYGDDPEEMVKFGNVFDQTARERLTNYSSVTFISARDGFVFASPSGQFQPNAFGLYDMHGNVYEWCQDWYDEDYYKNSPLADPHGPSSGSARVLRGGPWYRSAHYSRSANRNKDAPINRDDYSGFRVVRELE